MRRCQEGEKANPDASSRLFPALLHQRLGHEDVATTMINAHVLNQGAAAVQVHWTGSDASCAGRSVSVLDCGAGPGLANSRKWNWDHGLAGEEQAWQRAAIACRGERPITSSATGGQPRGSLLTLTIGGYGGLARRGRGG